MYKCPWCGNVNRGLMQDNGCKPNDEMFTLLCVAPMPADQTVFGAIYWDEFPDQEPVCGEQWEPNNSLNY